MATGYTTDDAPAWVFVPRAVPLNVAEEATFLAWLTADTDQTLMEFATTIRQASAMPRISGITTLSTDIKYPRTWEIG